MAGEAAPFSQDLSVNVAAAATGAEAVGIIEAPFAGTLTAAVVVPATALSGANTNSRTINVINRGQDGLGTTVMATKAYTSGVNLVAEDEASLTLSVVANATTVASGDVIEVQSLHIGTGLAGPQLIAKLTLSRTAGA